MPTPRRSTGCCATSGSRGPEPQNPLSGKRRPATVTTAGVVVGFRPSLPTCPLCVLFGSGCSLLSLALVSTKDALLFLVCEQLPGPARPAKAADRLGLVRPHRTILSRSRHLWSTVAIDIQPKSIICKKVTTC